MTEEDIKKEVLDYLDRLCLGIEPLEHPSIFEHIQAINKSVERYEEELREDNNLVLKRK